MKRHGSAKGSVSQPADCLRDAGIGDVVQLADIVMRIAPSYYYHILRPPVSFPHYLSPCKYALSLKILRDATDCVIGSAGKLQSLSFP